MTNVIRGVRGWAVGGARCAVRGARCGCAVRGARCGCAVRGAGCGCAVRGARCGWAVRGTRCGWAVRGAVIAVLLAGLPGKSSAQPATENVEVEPITCWWRSSTSAIRSGENFGLTLTCAVIETDTTKVVPDQSKLDSSVVQLPPFEVIGGSHAEDLKVPGVRFIQYAYRLRLINESAFGADVEVPTLTITYRIESQVVQGEAIQGRDLTYELKPISVRLLSVVPTDATDIREAPAAAFEAVAAREARGNTMQVIAYTLFGLAGVMALAALINLFRKRQRTGRVDRWVSSDRAVLAGAAGDLSEVRAQSRGGWTPELAGRALAGIRIAGSYLGSRPVGQAKATRAPAEGQILVRRLGRASTLVSGSVTAETVGKSSELHDSLLALTTARYGRRDTLDGPALDEALETGERVVRQLRRRHSVPAELLRSLTAALRGLIPGRSAIADPAKAGR